MSSSITYRDLTQLNWHRTEQALNDRNNPLPPFSVHIPLHFPESDTFVYWDGALNASLLPVPVGLQSGTPACEAALDAMTNRLLSFAPGEMPFLPDFRFTRMERLDGELPVIRSEYFHCDLLYRFDVCVAPNRTLQLRGSVTNLRGETAPAAIRCRLATVPERECRDYHYVPFRWDASRWLQGESASWENGVARYRGVPVAAVTADGCFDVCSESAPPQGTSADFNRDFCCERPHFVRPEQALTAHNGCLRLRTELPPGGTAGFELALRLDWLPDQNAPRPDYATAEKQAAAQWRNLLAGTATADRGDPEENHLITILRLTSLQLLVRHPDPAFLQPSQGGSSERFYVWIWEAMYMLRPLIAFGHFAPVRRVLNFCWSLQDGGSPPVGEFHSLDGAVGTTGPRWANATGSLLALSAEYLKLSRDQEFAESYLIPMARAVRWILGECAATRRCAADGTRPVNYGLMPRACATDGDCGYILSMTDNWLCRGAGLFLELPEARRLPDYEHLHAEWRAYRAEIDHAIDRLRRSDGFIDRKLTAEGQIQPKFESVCGAFLFHDSGLLSARDERMRALTDYCEAHQFDGFFCTPMDRDMIYIGNGEAAMFRFWLRNGAWKKAWCAAQIFRRCAVTADLGLTQERCSRTDRTFTPWQPNGSNNGRLLELLIQGLYLESDFAPEPPEILLFGGIAPFEFAERPRFALSGFHSSCGRLDLELETAAGRCRIEWENPPPAGTRLRCPEHLQWDFPETLDGRTRVLEGICRPATDWWKF